MQLFIGQRNGHNESRGFFQVFSIALHLVQVRTSDFGIGKSLRWSFSPVSCLGCATRNEDKQYSLKTEKQFFWKEIILLFKNLYSNFHTFILKLNRQNMNSLLAQRFCYVGPSSELNCFTQSPFTCLEKRYCASSSQRSIPHVHWASQRYRTEVGLLISFNLSTIKYHLLWSVNSVFSWNGLSAQRYRATFRNNHRRKKLTYLGSCSYDCIVLQENKDQRICRIHTKKYVPLKDKQTQLVTSATVNSFLFCVWRLHQFHNKPIVSQK